MFEYYTHAQAMEDTEKAKRRLHQQQIASAVQNAALGGADSVIVDHVTDDEISEILDAGFDVVPTASGKAEISWIRKDADAGDIDAE